MRTSLFLAMALVASNASAEPVPQIRGVEQLRELAPGVHAVALQQGEVVLLAADGQPEAEPTRLPAGWYYTELGHHRLTLAVAQLQSDKAAAEARASSLQYALSTRDEVPPASCVEALVLLVSLLFVLGVLVGRLVLPLRK